MQQLCTFEGGSNYFRVFHNELFGWVLFISVYIRLYGTDPFGHWKSYIDNDKNEIEFYALFHV